MLVARRTQAAEEDLQEIAFQIGLLSRRPNVADKIIDELIDKFLASFSWPSWNSKNRRKCARRS